MSRKDDKDTHAVVKKQLKSAIEQLENIFKELNKSKTLSEAITSLENKNKDIAVITNTIREKLKEELENRKPVLDFDKKSLEKVKPLGFILGKPFAIIKDQFSLEKVLANFIKKITSVNFLIPSSLNEIIPDEAKKSLEKINVSKLVKLSDKKSLEKINLFTLDKISRDIIGIFEKITEKDNEMLKEHISNLNKLFSENIIDACKVPDDIFQGYTDYCKKSQMTTANAIPNITTPEVLPIEVATPEVPSLLTNTLSNNTSSNNLIEKMNAIDATSNSANDNTVHSETVPINSLKGLAMTMAARNRR